MFSTPCTPSVGGGTLRAFRRPHIGCLEASRGQIRAKMEAKLSSEAKWKTKMDPKWPPEAKMQPNMTPRWLHNGSTNVLTQVAQETRRLQTIMSRLTLVCAFVADAVFAVLLLLKFFFFAVGAVCHYHYLYHCYYHYQY